ASLLPALPPAAVRSEPATADHVRQSRLGTTDRAVGRQRRRPDLHPPRHRRPAGALGPDVMPAAGGASRPDHARPAAPPRCRHPPFVGLDCGHLSAPAVRGVLSGPLGLDHPDWLGTIYLRDPGGLPRELQAELADRFADQSGAGPRVMAGFLGDPAEDVLTGRLLEELFAALSVLLIRLPALRERPADLLLLTATTVARVATLVGRPAAR